jgi:hypothetical protein
MSSQKKDTGIAVTVSNTVTNITPIIAMKDDNDT